MEEVALPECPVCLQVFNNEDTVPRVLPCGHSACEVCLPQLPQKFQNTIRCPACNQLVNYPTLGPSALPKNIHLLSFINQQNHNPSNTPEPHKQKQSSNRNDFIPSFWSNDLYIQWKDWVLPEDSISIETSGKDPLSLLQGRITCSSKVVSMLYIGSSVLSDSMFRYSYTVKLMHFLNQLQSTTKDELCLILKASSQCCRAYGLWMNLDDGSVFLVCESKNGDFDFQKKLNEVRRGDGLIKNVMENGEVNWGMPGFAVVGMEFCEALSSLHSNGLVSGCLSLSCFSSGNFGHVYVNLNEVLVLGRNIRNCIKECTASVFQGSEEKEMEKTGDVVLKARAFASPEVLLKLFHKEGVAQKCNNFECSVYQFSDVWSLACILISLLVEDSLVEELFNIMYQHFPQICEENFNENLSLYNGWLERVTSALETSLASEFASLQLILCRCLEFEPSCRPNVTDVWKCMRELVIQPHVDLLVSGDASGSMENMHHCLTLSNLCNIPRESFRQSPRKTHHNMQETSVGADMHPNGNELIEKDILEGLRIGKYESTDLPGHRDCITGLAVGGGYLFSSSFDKTVHVWSLQDLSHVHTFRSHEHRVMGVVFVDAAEPLCISGDNGGGLFVWSVGVSLGHEPLKKLYEEKDWRYSGIHALAISGTDHIYTGSGDTTIKAWSLRDYTLTCTMTGHTSVVSCVAVCDGVVYSGSWDGTIRLWSTNDHSSLAVLGDGISSSILSLSVDSNTIAAAHENGCLKLWRNDVLSTSIDSQNGAIFALDVKEKWIFMGGWNKALDVKELSGDEDELHIEAPTSVGCIACDSVITALRYWDGKLFVGFADGTVKVYRYAL